MGARRKCFIYTLIHPSLDLMDCPPVQSRFCLAQVQGYSKVADPRNVRGSRAMVPMAKRELLSSVSKSRIWAPGTIIALDGADALSVSVDPCTQQTYTTYAVPTLVDLC